MRTKRQNTTWYLLCVVPHASLSISCLPLSDVTGTTVLKISTGRRMMYWRSGINKKTPTNPTTSQPHTKGWNSSLTETFTIVLFSLFQAASALESVVSRPTWILPKTPFALHKSSLPGSSLKSSVAAELFGGFPK